MSAAIEAALERYWTWLRDRTILRQIEDWTEITTPYLDRHNDFVQILVRPDNGGFLLTDDGYTISDLEQSGCSLSTDKRKALLQLTLNGFGIRLEHGTLLVRTTERDFPQRKHNLVQAILAVNDLFHTASPYVASFFLEDVVSWLDGHGVRYTPRVKFAGQTGFDHFFNFVIPKSVGAPERLVKAVSKPTRSAIDNVIFAWVDTKGARDADALAYALLNDQDEGLDTGLEDALSSYEIRPVRWSGRADFVDDLAA